MAVQLSGDRIRPSAAFATLYEALAHVDMSQSVAESPTATAMDAVEAKVVYVGNF
jgi:hypothetical protein